jgi:hypothetical protein
MKTDTDIPSLFGDLQLATFDKPTTAVAPKRRDTAHVSADLMPGFDGYLAKASAAEAERQSEAIVAARLAQGLDEYGHSSEMNLQAAQRLWRAVIVRAYKDAIGLDLLLTNEDEDDDDDRVTDPKSVQERGLRWFVEFSEDFRHVCWWAGYEPDEVRNHALRKIEAEFELVYLTNKGNWKIDFNELRGTGE